MMILTTMLNTNSMKMCMQDNYVGKIYPTMYKYYDIQTHTIKVKSRPALIIYQPKNYLDTEYIVLPCSTMQNYNHRDAYYDVPIIKSSFPNTTIHKDCFIRCHKQTIIYKDSIDFSHEIADLKTNYEKTFDQIMAKVYTFQKTILMHA